MRRGVRAVLLALSAAVILLGAWLVPALDAHAADDLFDRFDVAYTVRADGSMAVEETVTLRFGSNSGRRGLQRNLVTREPYDADEDMIYEISNVRITSPDDVSTSVQQTRTKPSPRDEVLRIRDRGRRPHHQRPDRDVCPLLRRQGCAADVPGNTAAVLGRRRLRHADHRHGGDRDRHDGG